MRGLIWTRRAAAICACAVLTACGSAPNYGNGQKNLVSLAQFDPRDMSGSYNEIAGFHDPRAGCALGRMVADTASPTPSVNFAGCHGVAPHRAALRMVGPGRMAIGEKLLWVLWADPERDVLVLGAPDRSSGAVLSRNAHISPDKMHVAREIFDWNGFDVRRLALTVAP